MKLTVETVVFILLNSALLAGSLQIPLVLQNGLCGSNFSLDSTTTYRVFAAYPLNSPCRIRFHSTAGDIAFQFDNSSANYLESYVYLTLYDSSYRLLRLYYWISALLPLDAESLNSTDVIVDISGGNYRPFCLNFIISDEYGASSSKGLDGILGVAGGVFALSIGCTAVLFIITLCGIKRCCTCPSDPNYRQRRQQRMIEHLRRDGFTVSRDYGATGDAESEREPLNADVNQIRIAGVNPSSSYEDPPPAYSSINRTMNTSPNNPREPVYRYVAGVNQRIGCYENRTVNHNLYVQPSAQHQIILSSTPTEGNPFGTAPDERNSEPPPLIVFELESGQQSHVITSGAAPVPQPPLIILEAGPTNAPPAFGQVDLMSFD